MICRTNVAGSSGGSASINVLTGAIIPASASEGTIFVETDTEATEVEFCSSNAREGYAAGQMFIECSAANGNTESAFFILDSKRILYPVILGSVSQYKDGALSNLNAYLRKSNDWIQFSWSRIFLFNGNASDKFCTSITGGWEASNWRFESDGSGIAPTVTDIQGGIKITMSSGRVGSFLTKQVIKIPDWVSNLSGEFSYIKGNDDWSVARMRIVKRENTSSASIANVNILNNSGSSTHPTYTDTSFSLDISALRGQSYAACFLLIGNTDVRIKSVWFD